MPRKQVYARSAVWKKNMPSLSDLPGNLKRKKFTKALEGLGFSISKKGGKGSHFKATYEVTQKSVTMPSDMNKNTLLYILKEIEKCSGVTWEEIKKKL